jgi:hypothetical protein
VVISKKKKGFRKYDGIEYFAKISRRSISQWSLGCFFSAPFFERGLFSHAI